MGQKAEAYICPADDGSRTSVATGDNAALTMDQQGNVRQGPNTGGYWSYSLNTVCNSLGRFRNNFGNGLPWIDPLRATEVRNPSEFIVFVEEDAASYFNDEVVDPPAFTNNPQGDGGNMLTSRHNKYGNIGFLDSHVEAIKAADFNKGEGSDLPDMLKNPYSVKLFPAGTEGLE